jgi:hypothetical protein
MENNEIKKFAERVCAEVEEYLQSRTGIPVPTIENFCRKYGHDLKEIKYCKQRDEDLKKAISAIYVQGLDILQKFLVIDTGTLDFTGDDGKIYKLDKRGIIEQIKILHKAIEEKDNWFD